MARIADGDEALGLEKAASGKAGFGFLIGKAGPMGKRGPAPIPTALRVFRGETVRDEPKPRGSRPRMPADMSDAAKRVWRRVMRDFGETGVITAADTDTFRAYCEAVVGYVEATILLVRSGFLVRGQRGEPVKNPLHQIARDHRDGIRLLARELGLTPAARSGVAVVVMTPGVSQPLASSDDSPAVRTVLDFLVSNPSEMGQLAQLFDRLEVVVEGNSQEIRDVTPGRDRAADGS